jgi:hypothetical protein
LNKTLQLSPSEPTPTPNTTVTKNFWDSDNEDDEVHESQNLLCSYFSAVEKSLTLLMNKDFKHIKTLLQRFKTALQSSAAVKRVFSIAKNVLKDYPYRLIIGRKLRKAVVFEFKQRIQPRVELILFLNLTQFLFFLNI